MKNGLSELALWAHTLKLTKSQPRYHIKPKGVRIDELGLACPYTEIVFVGLSFLVRRTLSSLVNHKLKRNDLRKRFGLFILKGFPFQYYFKKKLWNFLDITSKYGN